MHEFSKLKDQAILELQKMNKQASKKQSFSPKIKCNNESNLFKNFTALLSDEDLLIIGLILILHQNHSDKWLFLSLLYILM